MDREATARLQPADAPTAVPTAAAPLFHAVSPAWMLDGAIPIEVRSLIMLLYGLAFEEAVRQNEAYKTFGSSPVSVATSYDEIIRHTGWNRTRIAEVIRAAEALRVLRLTGSKRAGMRYHILIALRSYSPRAIPEQATTPLFAGKRTVKRQRRQTVLGESFSPAPGPKKKTPETTSSPSTGPILDTFSPAPGPKDDDFSAEAGPRNETLRPAPGLDKTRSNVRARDHRVLHRNTSENNNRGELPNDLYDSLLLLGKKNDPELAPGNVIFEAALAEMITTLSRRFPGEAATVLDRLTRDPRVCAAAKPIGYLRAGISQGFLLEPAAIKKNATPHSPEGAFLALPTGLQELLLAAVDDGHASVAWCRERDIPPVALAHAQLLAARNHEQKDTETESPVQHLPLDLRDAITAALERGAIPQMLYFALRTATVSEQESSVTLIVPSGFLKGLIESKLLPTLTAQLRRPITVTVAPMA